MPDILAGQTIKSADRPPSVYELDTTLQDAVSSATFVTGTPVVDAAFTAPTSGRVVVSVSAAMRVDTAGGNGIVTVEIYEGVDASGVLVVPADDETHSLISIDKASNFHFASRVTGVTGLTPGAAHYARLVHRSLNDTFDISARDLAVIPTS